MPTTVTGLLLFVVLLLPGFAYVVGRERRGVERRLTAFRESATVVAVSVACEIAVLCGFAVIRLVLPWITPDVGRLIREGDAYVGTHYGSLAVWGLLLLLAAITLAYAMAMEETRQFLQRLAARKWVRRIGDFPPLRPLMRLLTATAPHTSTVSAWWLMFEDWHPGLDVHVGCLLDDGSYIEGRLASFNRSADDSPDRDIVLTAPLKHRLPDERQSGDYDAGAACISARRIVTMFVTHIPEPVSLSASAEAADPEAAAESSAQEEAP